MIMRALMIAHAWRAWKSRHGGRLGAGPAFVEAIRAAVQSLHAPDELERLARAIYEARFPADERAKRHAWEWDDPRFDEESRGVWRSIAARSIDYISGN